MLNQTISHYKILEKLGEGGMGVVYKAEDTKLKRIVALKFLPSSIMASEAEKTRFVHEAQAAAALNHPNICTIHEIDEVDGQMFIAMEYIEGQSLKAKIEAGPLKLDEALNIAMQVAEGLQAAHEKKITHRDIKPANIMLTPKGQAKIMDFGLAKLAGQKTRLTKTGMTLGTVAYMSPEQALGTKVDHRTDIWSLGVVLYEMLTGELPFKGDYEQAVIYSILNEEPSPIAEQRSEISPLLAETIETALLKNVEKRFQRMVDFLTQLKQVGSELSTMSVEKAKPIPAIAVLPFVNMSADPENEYFSDGLAEELLNALAKLEGLHVAARTSSFRFRGQNLDIREIGRQLNVGAVLEGSVRAVGKRMRVTAQLINVADGYHIWSERFDRLMEDVFAIQDEITLAIVNALKIKLLASEGEKLVKRYTENLEAYHLYLKGRYYFNKYSAEANQKGMQCYYEALERDPNYVLAYAGLADIFGQLAYWGFVRPGDALPKNQEFAFKAVALDNMCDEAHGVLAGHYGFTAWDWANAEKHVQRSLELNPNNTESHLRYALLLISLSRFDEATVECERLIKLDPLSPVGQSVITLNLFAQRQYGDTITVSTKALEMELHFRILHWLLWRAHSLAGDYTPAIEACKKVFTLWGHPEVAKVLKPVSKVSHYTELMRKGAEQMIAKSKKQFVSAYDIALFYAHAKMDEPAMHWLEKSYEEQAPRLHLLKVAPDFDPLRRTRRFKSLLKKLDLE